MRRLLFNLLIFTTIISTLWLTPAWATGVYDLPIPDSNTWVIDQAEAISRTNESKLNSILGNLAQTTGNQVRIVALRRLDYGDNIDTLSDQLFSKWYPTPEEQDNQTLIALDTLTNNVALRRGEKIKTLVDDATTDSIVEETIKANLKQGNKYNQALIEASDRLGAILSGQPDPGPTQIAENLNLEGTFAEAEETKKGSATLWVIGLLVLATVIPMATYFFYVGFSN